MPWNVGTKTISRIWAFVDRFAPGQTADRDEFDAAFDDVADSVNDALTYYDGRVAALEEADQWYLGVSLSDPTEARDGGPLVSGMYYIRSPEMSLRIYDAGTFRTARAIGAVTPYAAGLLESANEDEARGVLGLTALSYTPVAQVAQGGTGAGTADGALTNLGATAIGKGVIRAADSAAARTAIGALGVSDFGQAFPITSSRDLNPMRHFRQSSLTETPVVVIMGDSNATEAPTTTFDESDSLWGMLQARLAETNRHLDFTFHNRAIGGATWTHANAASLTATGLTLPAWAGDGSATWLANIEALAPDILFLSFGTNDRQNFTTPQFRAVLNTIRAWTKVPDIVLITNLNAKRGTADATISGAEAQDGRNFTAHFVRTWALFQGHGLIDLHRQFSRTVQGFDPRSTKFIGDTPSAAISITTSGVEGPSTQQDFGVELTLTGSAGLWSGRAIRLLISTNGVNGRSYLEVFDNAGSLAVKFIEVEDGPGEYLTVTSGVPTPTSGSFVLSVFVTDNVASIKAGGVTVFEGIIKRHGGTFAPVVSMTSGAAVPATARWFRAEWVKNFATLTDDQAFGSASIASSVEGGNDLNHLTSLGLSAIVRPALDAIDWRVPVLVEGTTIYPGSTERKVGIGTADPQGFLHVTKAAAAGYAPAGNANNIVAEDATTAGISVGVGTGSARINLGSVADTDAVTLFYSTASAGFFVAVETENALRVLSPTVDNTAGLQVLVREAGVNTLRTVSVGAADSGGTGFRMLRVPN